VGTLPQGGISLAKLKEYYLTNPAAKAAVDNMVAQLVGSGYYIVSPDERVKSLVEEFSDRVALLEWFEYAFREVIYSGNSWLEYPEDWRDPPEFVSLAVELTSIRMIRRDEGGGPIEYVQIVDGRENPLPADKFLHLAWGVVDRSAFGTGILYPLSVPTIDPRGDRVPPLFDIYRQMMNDLQRVSSKYPPRHIVTFDASDEVFERKIRPQLESLRPGENFATNSKVDFKELTVASRADYASLMDYMLNQLYLGLETPFLRLMLHPSSLADARVVMESWEPFRTMLHTFMARRFEKQIVSRLLQAHGVKPTPVRLIFGQPDRPEVNLDHILQAFQLGILSAEEARINLRNGGVYVSDATLPTLERSLS